MNQRKYIFILLLSIFSIVSNAQNSGKTMFDNTTVHEIHIDFYDDDYIESMNANYINAPIGGDATYIMADITIDGESIDSVGVRYKGFTSYGFEQNKNPIKIDFNEFVEGKKFDGLRKINLNNATADPAMQRDVICYDLMNNMGVSAPRTAYANVYYEGEFWGIFQVIEQIDKTFIKENFANDDGNLFKNLGWSKFEWLGDSKNAYKQIFSLKSNRELDNWDGFVNFVDFLNNSTDFEFENGIENIFNVDLFLKTLAVDVATNNWDSYLEHGRNWYMYEDTVSDIFHWIPWDYNLALGGTLGGGPVGGLCDLFPEFTAWTMGTDSVVFLNTSWPNSDIGYSWDFGDGNISTEKSPSHVYESLGVYTVCLELILDEECSDQICNVVDLNYDYNNCPSLSTGVPPNDEATAVFAVVVDYIPDCCDIWDSECNDTYGWVSEFLDVDNNGGNQLSGFKIDQSQNDGILIHRLLAVDKFKTRYYDHFCNLLTHHFDKEYYNNFINFNKELIKDHVAFDQNFLYSYNDFEFDSGEVGLKKYIFDRIDDLKSELETAGHDCNSASQSVKMGDLVINEVMASMDSLGGIVDPAGEYDDWIELHNNTDESIDLSDVYLSDSKTDLKKWQFPVGTTIGPKEYKIVWADKDVGQNGLHANFKLSKDSDELKLSNNDGSIIDSLSFVDQETNVALARVPNGTGDFEKQAPTFKVNNNWPTSTIDLNQSISFYPNPTSGLITFSNIENISKNSPVHVINSTGRLVLKTSLVNNQVDISDLVRGLYVIQMVSDKNQIITGKLVKL